MTDTTQSVGTEQPGQFIVQRLYVKDLSFEAPHVPEMFMQKWEPDMSLEVHCQNKVLDNNIYEVILSVTVTVKNNNQIAFLVEVKQAGIFSITGVNGESLDHVLGSFCPNMLFPYAREVISSQVTHASFPQLVLAPINFDALYLQKLQEKK